MDGAAKGCNLDQLILIFGVPIFKKENIMLEMQNLLIKSANVVMLALWLAEGECVSLKVLTRIGVHVCQTLNSSVIVHFKVAICAWF